MAPEAWGYYGYSEVGSQCHELGHERTYCDIPKVKLQSFKDYRSTFATLSTVLSHIKSCALPFFVHGEKNER